MRTETTFVTNAAEMESYKDIGIEKYRFLATLDFKTSAICASLDRKVFNVSEASPGVNMPPMHPNCRSTTIVIMDEETEKNLQRSAWDKETGTWKKVPANMTYEQWKAGEEAVNGVESFDERSIDKLRKMSYNTSVDRRQYEAYKVRLGTEAPKTFKDFQTVKYIKPNDYNELCGLYSYKGRVPEATKSD